MKTYKLGLILATGLATIFLGCSSGSDGGSSNTELTPEKAEQLASTAAEALPGCVYESDNMLAPAKSSSVMRLYTQTVKDMKAEKRVISREVEEIYEEQVGTCPTNPGLFIIAGEHENGVDNLTYTFNQYCSGDTYENTVVDGGFSVKAVGEPSDYGPIPQYMELKSGDLSVKETSSEGVFTSTLKAKSIKFTYGNGENDPTASNPNVLEIGLLSAADGRTKEEFSVSDVQVRTYGSGTNSVVVVDSATYTDSENGTVKVSTTPLTINENGEAIGGDVIVEGANGSTLIMQPDPSVQNGFSVEVEGETIGVMNCSGLSE